MSWGNKTVMKEETALLTLESSGFIHVEYVRLYMAVIMKCLPFVYIYMFSSPFGIGPQPAPSLPSEDRPLHDYHGYMSSGAQSAGEVCCGQPRVNGSVIY